MQRWLPVHGYRRERGRIRPASQSLKSVSGTSELSGKSNTDGGRYRMGCPLNGLSCVIEVEDASFGGVDAGNRSSNAADRPGRIVEAGANGTGGAPASNADCPSPVAGTRARCRIVALLATSSRKQSSGAAATDGAATSVEAVAGIAFQRPAKSVGASANARATAAWFASYVAPAPSAPICGT